MAALSSDASPEWQRELDKYQKYVAEIQRIPVDSLPKERPHGKKPNLEGELNMKLSTLRAICKGSIPTDKIHAQIKELEYERRWREIDAPREASGQWLQQARDNLQDGGASAAVQPQAEPPPGPSSGHQQPFDSVGHQANAVAPRALVPARGGSQARTIGGRNLASLQSNHMQPLNLQPSARAGASGRGGPTAKTQGSRAGIPFGQCTSCDQDRELVGPLGLLCLECSKRQGPSNSVRAPNVKQQQRAAAQGARGAGPATGGAAEPKRLGTLEFYGSNGAAPAYGPRPHPAELGGGRGGGRCSGIAAAASAAGAFLERQLRTNCRTQQQQQQAQQAGKQGPGRRRQDATADEDYDPPARRPASAAAGRQRGGQRRPASGAGAPAAVPEPICLDDSSDEEPMEVDDAGAAGPGPSSLAAAAAAAGPAAAGAAAGGVSTRRGKRASSAAAAAAAAAPPPDPFGSLASKLAGLRCCFPPDGDVYGVEIIAEDLARLERGEFLNDTCIDFYIKYIEQQLKPEVRQRYHFFNSFFVKKLREKAGGPAGNGGKMVQEFERVKNWTKHVDIFSKDYVFVPIHDHLHWSLMLICHPGEVGQAEHFNPTNRVNPEAGTPLILHLDSLDGSHVPTPYYTSLRSYLGHEWRRKAEDETQDSVPRRWLQAWREAGKEPQWPTFGRNVLPGLRMTCRLPKQDNHFDCGLFLLSYMEFFAAGSPSRIVLTDKGQAKDVHALDVSPEGADQETFLQKTWFFKANTARLRDHLRFLICQLLLQRMAPDDARRGTVEGVIRDYQERPLRPGERYLPPREFLEFRRAAPGEPEPANDADVMSSDSERVGGEEDPRDVMQSPPPRRVTRAVAKQTGAELLEGNTLDAIELATRGRRKSVPGGAAGGAAGAGPSSIPIDLASPDKASGSDAGGVQPLAGASTAGEAGAAAGRAGAGGAAAGEPDEDLTLDSDSGDEGQDVVMMDAAEMRGGGSPAAAPAAHGVADEAAGGDQERPSKRPKRHADRVAGQQATDAPAVAIAAAGVEAMDLDDSSGVEAAAGAAAARAPAAAPEARLGPAAAPAGADGAGLDSDTDSKRHRRRRRRRAAGDTAGAAEEADAPSVEGEGGRGPSPPPPRGTGPGPGPGRQDDEEEDDPESLPGGVRRDASASDVAAAAAGPAESEHEADGGEGCGPPGASGSGDAGAAGGDAAAAHVPRPSAGKRLCKRKQPPPTAAAGPAALAAVVPAASAVAQLVHSTAEAVQAELAAAPVGRRASPSPPPPPPQCAAPPGAGRKARGPQRDGHHRERSASASADGRPQAAAQPDVRQAAPGGGAQPERPGCSGPHISDPHVEASGRESQAAGGRGHSLGSAERPPPREGQAGPGAHGRGDAAGGTPPLHVPERRPGCNTHVRWPEDERSPVVDFYEIRPDKDLGRTAQLAPLDAAGPSCHAGAGRALAHAERGRPGHSSRQHGRTAAGAELPEGQAGIDESIMDALGPAPDAGAAQAARPLRHGTPAAFGAQRRQSYAADAAAGAGCNGEEEEEDDEDDLNVDYSYPTSNTQSSGLRHGPAAAAGASAGQTGGPCRSEPRHESGGAQQHTHHQHQHPGPQPVGMDLGHISPARQPRQAGDGSAQAGGSPAHSPGLRSGAGPPGAIASHRTAGAGAAAGCVSAPELFGQTGTFGQHAGRSLFAGMGTGAAAAAGPKPTGAPPASAPGLPQPANRGTTSRSPSARLPGLHQPINADQCRRATVGGGMPFRHEELGYPGDRPGAGAAGAQRHNRIRKEKNNLRRQQLAGAGQPGQKAAGDSHAAQPMQPMQQQQQQQQQQQPAAQLPFVLPPTAESEEAFTQEAPPPQPAAADPTNTHPPGVTADPVPDPVPAGGGPQCPPGLHRDTRTAAAGMQLGCAHDSEAYAGCGGGACAAGAGLQPDVGADTQASDAGLSLNLHDACLTQAGEGGSQAAAAGAGRPGDGAAAAGRCETAGFPSLYREALRQELGDGARGQSELEPCRRVAPPTRGRQQALTPVTGPNPGPHPGAGPGAEPVAAGECGGPQQPIDLASFGDAEEAVPESEDDVDFSRGMDWNGMNHGSHRHSPSEHAPWGSGSSADVGGLGAAQGRGHGRSPCVLSGQPYRGGVAGLSYMEWDGLGQGHDGSAAAAAAAAAAAPSHPSAQPCDQPPAGAPVAAAAALHRDPPGASGAGAAAAPGGDGGGGQDAAAVPGGTAAVGSEGEDADAEEGEADEPLSEGDWEVEEVDDDDDDPMDADVVGGAGGQDQDGQDALLGGGQGRELGEEADEVIDLIDNDEDDGHGADPERDGEDDATSGGGGDGEDEDDEDDDFVSDRDVQPGRRRSSAARTPRAPGPLWPQQQRQQQQQQQTGAQKRSRGRQRAGAATPGSGTGAGGKRGRGQPKGGASKQGSGGKPRERRQPNRIRGRGRAAPDSGQGKQTAITGVTPAPAGAAAAAQRRTPAAGAGRGRGGAQNHVKEDAQEKGSGGRQSKLTDFPRSGPRYMGAQTVAVDLT